MSISRVAFALLAGAVAVTGQQLPSLRIEAVAGGSVFHVTNAASQPLTAYLIELVDYPGSSYTLFQEEVSTPLAPGAGKRIPVTNMTVGAAPEYVKITAAVYADGSTAGDASKVELILGRRKAVLETTHEISGRLEKAKAAGTAKTAVAADLRQWADSLPPEGKSRRLSAASVNAAAARLTISGAAARLDHSSIDETLAELRTAEQSLAAKH
jgi:hypothetical protein